MHSAQGVKLSNSLEMTDRNATGQEVSSLPEGVVCTHTLRVVIISPFPNRLGELLDRLTSECFDVLVFHRYDPLLMKELPVHSVVYDLTASKEVEQDAQHAISLFTHAQRRSRLLFLVKELPAGGESPGEAAEFLSWPASGIQEVIRRLRQEASPMDFVSMAASRQYVFKDLTIDARKMTAYRGRVKLELTKTEYEMLLLLIQAEGAVLSREEILNQVWGSLYFGGSNVVDVHVKSLRKKLGDSAGKARYISTVRGVGYRLADD